jgi:hypothetical protein
MLNAYAGEIVIGRPMCLGKKEDGDGTGPEAMAQAAALLASPRLLLIDSTWREYRYVVALSGAPAVVELDFDVLSGPKIAVRTVFSMMDEANRLLDKFEAKVAALSGTSVAVVNGDTDDLPF